MTVWGVVLSTSEERVFKKMAYSKEKQAEYGKAWAKANPDKVREIKRRFREKHKERIYLQRKARRAANREKLDAAKRKWESENPEIVSMQRVRARMRRMNQMHETGLRRHYAITADSYAKAVALQSGVCLICGEHRTTKQIRRLVVDHDHASGLVRGLLCHRCNCGLGYFADKLELIRRAADYLVVFNALPPDLDWVMRVEDAVKRLLPMSEAA